MLRQIRQPLTSELSHKLGAMTSGSTTFSDGLPAEFCRSLWKVVGVTLAANCNRAVSDQRVSASFLVGLVVLLLKRSRDMR